MGKPAPPHPPVFLAATLILLLLPALAADSSGPSRDDVSGFLSRTGDLLDKVDSDLALLQGFNIQCSGASAAACNQARARVSAVSSLLKAKQSIARIFYGRATQKFGENAPASDVLKEAGSCLDIVGSGIELARAEAARIPDSCPDEDYNDLCSIGKGAANDALSILSQVYQYRKSEHGQLVAQLAPDVPTLPPEDPGGAGTTPKPPPSAQEIAKKNDRLMGVYPKLGEAQAMRQTMDNLRASGASEQTLSSSRMQIAGVERQASDVYDSILLDSRYKHDFWTNWDYATLKKNQGDFEGARQLYAAALADSRVSAKDKADFMERLQAQQQAALGFSSPPRKDDKVVKSMRESLRSQYDALGLKGYSTYMDFHSSFVFALAKLDKPIQEMKRFRDLFTGANVEKGAGQAGQ